MEARLRTPRSPRTRRSWFIAGVTSLLTLLPARAVLAQGEILGWGGQVAVGEGQLSDFVAVAAGGEHSLGLRSDGTVVGWGRSNSGQCDVPTPNWGFVAVAAGYYHSLGVKTDGSVVAWGEGPGVPSPNSGFVAVAAGSYHSLGLKADGSVVAWGDNEYGQCTVPSPNSGFVAVAGGVYHSLGLKADGTIVAWGRSDTGACDLPSPNSGFVVVAAGQVKGGREVWTPLGSDYTEACRKHREGKRSPVVENTGRVSQLADVWLGSYIATARNEKGQRVARVRVEMYLKPFLGLYVASRVKSDDIRAYRLWLEGKRISVQTVAHILSDARCFFGWAEDAGYIGRSPIPKRILPRVQETPPKRLSDAEVARLLQLPDPWGFAIRVGLGTGLRWGEMMRARAEDVGTTSLTVSQTKSGRIRRIPLSDDLLAEIRGHVGLLLPFGHPSVFARKVRRLSGIEGFHPHQLRHTYACRWLEAGGSLVALQELLGHASITTTQRYARLTEAAVQMEAARVMGKAMGNAMGNIALVRA